jgi:hypothetical protein
MTSLTAKVWAAKLDKEQKNPKETKKLSVFGILTRKKTVTQAKETIHTPMSPDVTKSIPVISSLENSKSHVFKRSRKSKFAPISSICSILLGGIISLISTFSFIINITTSAKPEAILLDLAIMTISYLTVWQGFYYTIMERIAKEKADEQWDCRIQPVLDLMQDTAGRIIEIEEEMVATRKAVKSTMEFVTQSQSTDLSKAYVMPGMTFKFSQKIQILIFFTFSALVYVSSYPLGIVHYFILGLYLIWWGFITNEYKLFGNTTSWVYAVAPILTIPTTGIIMSSIYGLNVTIGILFAFMLLYVYSYYSWASYITTGAKVIDLKPIIQEIRQKLKELQKTEVDREIDNELKDLVK